jgi:hypothetical protein
MTKLTPFQLIQGFNELGDDQVVPDQVARIVLNVPASTFRKNFKDNPKLPKIQTSAQRWGRRVGNLRALIRATK